MTNDNDENDNNSGDIHHCWIAWKLLIQNFLHLIPSVTCYNHKQCHHICLKIILKIFCTNRNGLIVTYAPTSPGITRIFGSKANIFWLSFIKQCICEDGHYHNEASKKRDYISDWFILWKSSWFWQGFKVMPRTCSLIGWLSRSLESATRHQFETKAGWNCVKHYRHQRYIDSMILAVFKACPENVEWQRKWLVPLLPAPKFSEFWVLETPATSLLLKVF